MDKQKQNILLAVLTVVMLVGIGLGMMALIMNGHADYAPLVIPVGMVIAVIIGLPVLLAGGKATDADAKTQEAVAIDAIQTARGAVANKMARAQHEIDNIKRMQGTATKAEAVGTVIALGLIVAALIAVVVGVIITQFVVVIMGCVVFTLTIAITLMVMLRTEKTLNQPIDAETLATQSMTGEVVACAAQSTRYVGRDLNGKRLQQVTYRVKIKADDQEYLSLSHTFYNTGEQVTFVPRKNRLCTIVENGQIW